MSSQLSQWRTHLTKTRKLHPTYSLKEAMIAASKTYKKKKRVSVIAPAISKGKKPRPGTVASSVSGYPMKQSGGMVPQFWKKVLDRNKQKGGAFDFSDPRGTIKYVIQPRQFQKI